MGVADRVKRAMGVKDCDAPRATGRSDHGLIHPRLRCMLTTLGLKC